MTVVAPRFDVDDPTLAAAAWSRLSEGADPIAGALTQALGPCAALRTVFGWARDLEAGRHIELPTRGVASVTAQRVARQVARWRPRLELLDPLRELSAFRCLGGTLIRPGMAWWPRALDDLGVLAPHCLWVRAEDAAVVQRAFGRSIAIVGARAATPYGELMAGELAAGLVDEGVTVVSGGAFGIDAAAHRGALAAGHGAVPTVAVMAGGPDRLYPAANRRLLEQIIAVGALLTEAPPGSAPMKNRFLTRNRLIAALSGATIVVEAAERSGALNTARWAHQLLRPVGAVPGPVTSMSAGGCHHLIRANEAVCLTSVADALELIEAIGVREGAVPHQLIGDAAAEEFSPSEKVILDALPLGRPAAIDVIARLACRTHEETMASLGRLELRGVVRREGAGWRLVRAR